MFVSGSHRRRIATRADASIMHADLDSFYASVEQRDNPGLRGRPVAVGGGVVLAASYEAKACGVRTPMPGRKAQALCPDLIFVRPRMSAYSDASAAVFEIFRDTTPWVEGISVDEAFLDVRGLSRLVGPPAQIATTLRQRVAREVGLPISVGIARSKFLAKVASAVSKPDGLLEVPPDRELRFLHPLPVERLWGVGAVTAGKLHDGGITHVGQLARLPERQLATLVGPGTARHLHALAWAQDPRRVETGRRRKSIGAQRAIGWGPNRDGIHPEGTAEESLLLLVDRVTGRMRAAGRVGRTVTLRLRFTDFGRATRSATMARPTADTATIGDTALDLLSSVRPLIAERGVTLVGVAVSNFPGSGGDQPELPFGDEPDRHALDAAMDQVRDRFGGKSLTRGVHLGRDPGLHVPLLPD
ncbi:DNA polymerase IV [Jongsikchunia kroppenstedtii]|uniref:DNA polymerase IV n=1 Tax=Jongsikchunia kroppenstedtii TaxID=1121721 RepID=UPI00036368B8|nr:DNA polymerase IV [Jongsikchunia kroppenstedtii]